MLVFSVQKTVGGGAFSFSFLCHVCQIDGSEVLSRSPAAAPSPQGSLLLMSCPLLVAPVPPCLRSCWLPCGLWQRLRSRGVGCEERSEDGIRKAKWIEKCKPCL